MGLTKYKLGDLLKFVDSRNENLEYGINDVKGISIQKIFIETKADMTNVSLKPYYIVRPDDFAYVTVTSRNGEKITLAHNNTQNTYIVSSSYVVFRVCRQDILLSDFLYMYFNRPEFDHYARFNSWGSARETFSWDEMCDIDIDLPPVDIQQKYVDVYNSMLANQQSYERGLEDLKLVCDAYIEELRREMPSQKIGTFLELSEERNDDGKCGLDDVRGVSIEKKFIPTKADMKRVNLRPYYTIKPREFAYVPVTSRNGEKISIALNTSEDTYICSSSYIVFSVQRQERLWPAYLQMYFERGEFNRYARFNSWGSARETFNFDDMCDVAIPIPDIKVQKAISDIYAVYVDRKQINDHLKERIKSMCPILIKGSLEEAGA
ncbi:MAG: restriction endonuclease subunit S [Bilifractor sp.]|nr:restriction endonuclease subunit S [Bilifractor sp.]